jgi:hypothetical protein
MRENLTYGSMRGGWKHDMFAGTGLSNGLKRSPVMVVRQPSTLRAERPPVAQW